jgi:hypothetical protein
MSVRSFLYRLARLLGDAQAVRRGRVAERAHNRLLGRLLSRFIPWR